jgi:hypothetical protein
MGSPSEPAVPPYSRFRMHRKRPQVLGLDLNRSEDREPPAVRKPRDLAFGIDVRSVGEMDGPVCSVSIAGARGP